MAEVNDVMQEIQGEIDDKKKELEIEVVDNPPPKQETKVEEKQPEPKQEEPKQEKAEEDAEYGRKVQARIKKVIAEKKKAEEEALE